MQQSKTKEAIRAKAAEERIPEARYDYYRRCQVFRRNGEQCKAPAEKGSYICHAHAGQLAWAVRRERERRALLSEAVAEMRRRGNAEYEAKDLFMDFTGIQVTLAKMMQALIDGRVDCKTAGRLVVQLQTASKLLWMAEKAKARSTAETRRRGEERRLQQISADERRLSERKALTTKNTKRHEEERQVICGRNHLSSNHLPASHFPASQGEKPRIGLIVGLPTFTDIRGLAHGPPEWARAA